MSMKEAVSRISTYSADTFGVCSALYELGGMIVIHDPSGCNSTYATHDEPRWYDTDSLIFISGLTEMDAIMGNDDKLVHDVAAAARDFSPAFIVLLSTPVPLMTGADMDALAVMIEEETGIMTMAAPTNNMNGYEKGISWAMEMLAQRMVREETRSAGKMSCSWQPEFAACGGAGRSARSLSVNILGATPLDFSVNGSVESLRQYLCSCGFSVCSTWAMGSSLEEIRNSGRADVNLVVSGSALAAAEEMKRRFDMPYVVGLPVGQEMKRRIAAAIVSAHEKKENCIACAGRKETCEPADIVIIGEGVSSASLAAALEHERNHVVSVFCPLTKWDGVLSCRDEMVSSEGELRERLAEFTGSIIADPLYKLVCPPAAHFVPLGHRAFSGRLYQERIPDLIADFEGFIDKIQGGCSYVHE